MWLNERDKRDLEFEEETQELCNKISSIRMTTDGNMKDGKGSLREQGKNQNIGVVQEKNAYKEVEIQKAQQSEQKEIKNAEEGRLENPLIIHTQPISPGSQV